MSFHLIISFHVNTNFLKSIHSISLSQLSTSKAYTGTSMQMTTLLMVISQKSHSKKRLRKEPYYTHNTTDIYSQYEALSVIETIHVIIIHNNVQGDYYYQLTT